MSDVTSSESPSLVRASRWSDGDLVAACRDGNQEAWTALVAKYKNLVFSIPIKYGLSRADSADIFQAVWLDLLHDLPQLREPQALRCWLIRTTAHKCWHWRERERRYPRSADDAGQALDIEAPPDTIPETLLFEVEREQAVRSAITRLPERCRRMIAMLFFETPPRSYSEVATDLGVATGSVGFLRQRCLRRVRRELEKSGW
jgi:RNA polymerase sigma factor (sigma-70 family)